MRDFPSQNLLRDDNIEIMNPVRNSGHGRIKSMTNFEFIINNKRGGF